MQRIMPSLSILQFRQGPMIPLQHKDAGVVYVLSILVATLTIFVKPETYVYDFYQWC